MALGEGGEGGVQKWPISVVVRFGKKGGSFLPSYVFFFFFSILLLTNCSMKSSSRSYVYFSIFSIAKGEGEKRDVASITREI